ncbi:MAG: peptidylprolyl isomerase [Thiotrichales bacterium]
MQIASGRVVTLDYVLKNEAGQELERSTGETPYVYLHGGDDIIPGLEKALEGRAVGDALEIVVIPEEGYGEYDDTLIQVVPREMFGDAEINVGMMFHAETAYGHQVVVVREVVDDSITVDGNHPMAGATLYFDVSVQDVRDATPEELNHGHAHGHGECAQEHHECGSGHDH